MKVLTIREPFVSLIKEGIKTIETRSFKTNYRGELFIHASKSKVIPKNLRNPKVLDLLQDKNYKYGMIVLKCYLVDCIYMDEKFIEKIKNNKNEYLCGRYEIGRYAWVLKNIEILNTPISAKGQLGIWNYNKK